MNKLHAAGHLDHLHGARPFFVPPGEQLHERAGLRTIGKFGHIRQFSCGKRFPRQKQGRFHPGQFRLLIVCERCRWLNWLARFPLGSRSTDHRGAAPTRGVRYRRATLPNRVAKIARAESHEGESLLVVQRHIVVVSGTSWRAFCQEVTSPTTCRTVAKGSASMASNCWVKSGLSPSGRAHLKR